MEAAPEPPQGSSNAVRITAIVVGGVVALAVIGLVWVLQTRSEPTPAPPPSPVACIDLAVFQPAAEQVTIEQEAAEDASLAAGPIVDRLVAVASHLRAAGEYARAAAEAVHGDPAVSAAVSSAASSFRRAADLADQARTLWEQRAIDNAQAAIQASVEQKRAAGAAIGQAVALATASELPPC